jgi:hypothetical protein
MLLNEMFNLDEWSDFNPSIDVELTKQGYKGIGKGVDASAYSEPNSKDVLKIFGTKSYTKGSEGKQLSRDQQMFIIWAKFCMKNVDNEFLPKFSGYERFVFDQSTYLQIRMERLTQATKLGWAAWTLADEFKEGQPMGFDVPKIVHYFNVRYPKDYNTLHEALGNDRLLKLATTINSLLKISTKMKWHLDLHEKNFMMRGNVPVILDPWVVPRHSGK